MRRTIIVKSLVFITNANPIIDVTIAQLYETTYLIYCIFYISKNLLKNVKSKFDI